MNCESTPTPVPSATLILVRPQGIRYQVYLLRRSLQSGFMAGHYVFPGGVLDVRDRDADLWEPHVDMTKAEIERNLGGGVHWKEILAYGVAAIRETLEEAGVFLAEQSIPSAGDLAGVCSLRLTDGFDADAFVQTVASDRWRLSLSALRRWSHWITPEGMKRRFDTRFFLAVMPEGQHCRPDAGETVHGLWTTPEKGLRENLDGTLPLSPPTLVTLHQLYAYPGFAALMKAAASRPWNAPILPRLVPLDDGALIVEPWDPDYRKDRIRVDPDRLIDAVPPVGEAFSRIWFSGGRYRPVYAT